MDVVGDEERGRVRKREVATSSPGTGGVLIGEY